MSGMGIAGVLAAHRLVWSRPYRAECHADGCGWTGHREDEHDDHVADAIAAHIGAVLDRLRGDAVGVAQPWEKFTAADGHTSVASREADEIADAVLGVVRAAMGGRP